MNARALTLAASLLTLTLAQGQDYGGLYAIRGKDSQGHEVAGWLRISPEGQLDRAVQAGARRDRTVGVAEVEGGAQRAVFRYRKTSKAGLAGVLGGSESRGKTAEELTVTWTAGGAVQLDYARGDYRSREEGSRAYDLRTLRDEPGQRAKISLGATANGAEFEVLEYEYVRSDDLSKEARRYLTLRVGGASAISPGLKQRLRRTGATWTPEEGDATAAVGVSQLVKATYRPEPITPLMPSAPVPVGASWPIEPARLKPILNLPKAPLPGSTLTGKLLDVRAEEGGLRYVVELAYDVQVDMTGIPGTEGFTTPATFRGRLLVNQGPSDHQVTSDGMVVTADTRAGQFRQEGTSYFKVEERR